MVTRSGLKAVGVLVLAGCVATILATAVASSTAAQARLAALPAAPPAPADNPTTPERVALGRLLFWDPILSGQKDVACATCHHPAFGYSDGLDLSIGANGVGLGPARAFAAGHASRPVKRNSQTVLNVAFNGLTVGGDCHAGGRADVLGSPGSQPRGAGARADQGARGNARRRVSRGRAVAGRRVAAERHRRVPPAVRPRVRRNDAGERAAISAARSRRFSGRSWPPTRRSTATCAATRPRSAPSRCAAWSGSSRSDASTATTGRCSRTSRRTCSACRTTRSCLNRIRA